jgi:hypothetical protein
VTGYATAFFFLPIHVLTHRFAPTDPAPPISSFGPSELDFEYVKVALQSWPIRSALLYGPLVLGVALHAADGFAVLWSTWAPKSKNLLLLSAARRRRQRRALASAAVFPVLMGLVVVAREPLFVFASAMERYRAALRHSFVYRL